MFSQSLSVRSGLCRGVHNAGSPSHRRLGVAQNGFDAEAEGRCPPFGEEDAFSPASKSGNRLPEIAAPACLLSNLEGLRRRSAVRRRGRNSLSADRDQENRTSAETWTTPDRFAAQNARESLETSSVGRCRSNAAKDSCTFHNGRGGRLGPHRRRGDQARRLPIAYRSNCSRRRRLCFDRSECASQSQSARVAHGVCRASDAASKTRYRGPPRSRTAFARSSRPDARPPSRILAEPTMWLARMLLLPSESSPVLRGKSTVVSTAIRIACRFARGFKGGLGARITISAAHPPHERQHEQRRNPAGARLCFVLRFHDRMLRSDLVS